VSRPTRRQRLGSYPAYLSTPRRPSSHPRGFRLIHLSKSCVAKVLRRLPLKVRRRSTFPPERRCLSAGGGGILSFVPPLSIAFRKDFLTTRSEPRSTRNKPVLDPSRPACARPDRANSTRDRQYSHTPTRTGRFATSLELFKRCCLKQQATRNHKRRSSKHRGRFPNRWQE